MRRMLMILVACLAPALFVATAAGARDYPPAVPAVVTDSGAYHPGDPVTITASGFPACPGGVLTFTITPPGGGTPIVITVQVGADGTAHVTLPAPGVFGRYTVTVSCGTVSSGTSFVVSALPTTGANSVFPLKAASVLVVVGLGLFFVGLRRRQSAPGA